MYLILQQDDLENFILATGITTKVREFVRMSFKELGIEIEFLGNGQDERVVVTSNSGDFDIPLGQVKVDPNYFRPTEVDLLIGDASKAKEKLG